VKDGEQRALETLVELFDWLDSLTPQPTRGIVDLYETSRAIEINILNTLAQMEQRVNKRADIDKLMMTLQKKAAVSFHIALGSQSYAHRT